LKIAECRIVAYRIVAGPHFYLIFFNKTTSVEKGMPCLYNKPHYLIKIKNEVMRLRMEDDYTRLLRLFCQEKNEVKMRFAKASM
jgi:hypothetical protein